MIVELEWNHIFMIYIDPGKKRRGFMSHKYDWVTLDQPGRRIRNTGYTGRISELGHISLFGSFVILHSETYKTLALSNPVFSVMVMVKGSVAMIQQAPQRRQAADLREL
tara:strand:- start:4982 stop:5308 length:327 start_codon:yes stop_codon:yes gene_type:complete